MPAHWADGLIHPPLPVDLLIRSTALLALAWAAHCVLWRANPRWRLLLWRAVAVSLAVLPVALVCAPRVAIEVERPAIAETGVRPAEPEPLPSTLRAKSDSAPAASRTVATGTGVERSHHSSKTNDTPVSRAWGRVEADGRSPAVGPWTVRLGMAVWLGALAFLAARFGVGSRLAVRLIRRSRPAPRHVVDECRRVARALGCRTAVPVRVAAELSTPLLAGFRRPVLLLPAHVCEACDRAALSGILAHELAHVCTRDLQWGYVFQALRIVLWFHPLVWRVHAAHATACEHVSDALAARFVGDVRGYARTLARVAIESARGRTPAAGIPMARASQIRRRLERLRRKATFRPLRGRHILPAYAGLMLAVSLIGGVRFVYAIGSLDAAEDEIPAARATLDNDDTATSGREEAADEAAPAPSPPTEPAVDPAELAGLEAQSPAFWERVIRVSMAPGTTKTRTLNVWSWTGGRMEYAIEAEPASLLEVAPGAGISDGEVNRHRVHFAAADRAPGSYRGRIVIHADAPNSPVTIPVEVDVTAGAEDAKAGGG